MPRRIKTIKNTRRTLVVRPNCALKKRYKDQKSAEAAAETQMLTSLTLELSVYQCSDCNGWHLTRQSLQGRTS